VQLLGIVPSVSDRDRDPIALCRCGKSKRKPFCDGTHKLVGFRASGTNG